MEGTRLGPYRIDRELGAGGMGKVYAATVVGRVPGLDAGAHVALKVVHPHLLETEGFFLRFLKEAQIGASIHHENVVRTFMADALGQQHYLVMEYVEGQTLADLQRELDKVPEELCRHVAREICKGLAAIHDAGVVHRDLKPENVLITEEHVVKVMDLGVAQLTAESIRLSQTGAFVGSVEYAAPEQFRGGDVDHRCDLHALGVLLYELSTGQHPYRADDFRAVMHHVMDDEPRRLGEVNPQLSAFFEEVVHTLLQKSRDDRFADARALLCVLEDGEDSAWWKERAKALQVETKRPIRRIRIPRETAVYGREKEVARLRDLYEQAKAGDGQVVLIEGEAGIGKSRLVDELIGRLQQDGEDLNFLFGSYPPGGASTASGGFSSAYREHFGESGSAPYLAQTPLLVPAYDAILRGEPAPKEAVELTKDSLATCFVHATRNLAEERPTAVLIDDLHFAPEEARALFMSLALAVPGHRILLVGTMRPGVPEDWVANLSRLDHATHMGLSRLGPKDLALLLNESFHSEQLAHQLGVQIGLKSDGNPFFAFEIIRGLREGQFITQKEDGTWASTRVIDEIAIPSSVLDLVNARVADLSEDERNLLDVAACWGFDFDPVLVGDVLGLARIPLLRSLGQIERQHRLVRASGRTYVFDHHQVQEALYGSLSELLREEYHAALADALAARTKAAEKDPETLDGALCVDLCEHYLNGARGEVAVRYLPAAQTHLSRGYLHAQVASLAERALAVSELLTGTERGKTLLRLASALDVMGHRARQEECVREAEDLAEAAEDAELRSQAARALGILYLRTARFADAEVAHRRALEIAVSRGDRNAEAGANVNLGNVCQSQGRSREARAYYQRALALSREVESRPGVAIATGNLGNALLRQGLLPEAREHYERFLQFSREIRDREGEASATGNLGLIFQAEGRLREAREHCERHLALSREIGHRAGEAAATGNLGAVLYAQGRLRDASEQYERHLALSREIGDTKGEATATGNLGTVLFDEGRLPAAREYQARSAAVLREIGDRAGEAIAMGNLGVISLAEGRLPEARTALEQALALSREIGRRGGEAIVTGNLGMVYQCEGRLPEAREYLERSLALSREFGTVQNEACAQHYLGSLLREEGELARSEERLQACLAVCAESGRRNLEAETRRALGSLRAALSRADGNGGEGGRESLVAARELANDLGIPGTMTLARCELALLPGGDAHDALAALAEHAPRLSVDELREARLLLWKATGDRAHLEEAKRLLDAALAQVPDEYHDSMRQNVRVNREILAAWRAEFGEEEEGHVRTESDSDDDQPGASESATRIVPRE